MHTLISQVEVSDAEQAMRPAVLRTPDCDRDEPDHAYGVSHTDYTRHIVTETEVLGREFLLISTANSQIE